MEPVVEKIKALYGDRGRRARELRAAGRKVVGYFCCFPPIEMLSALDLVPYRIQGNVNRPIGEADSYLETVSCSFVRSCFDLALGGHYDFLDGIIVPHSCDTVQRIYDLWARYRKPELAHFLNVPHMVQPSSFTFFKNELLQLQRGLEGLAGRPMDVDRLGEAVALHNENRALLRELYDLRKSDPPLIAGSEVMKAVVAGMGLPVAEFSGILRELIADVRGRRPATPSGRPRVLLGGSELDDVRFVHLLEDAGADVVVDDVCTGTRSFWPMVPETRDPLDGIASRYLGDINCPRTYRPQMRPRSADLENRFGYLRRFVEDFRVRGLIMYIIRFCDTHELDLPDVTEYFAQLKVPVLPLEEEYRVANEGQIRTRVEAFLETLEA